MNTAAQNINTVFFDGLYKDVWRKIIPEGLTAAEVDFLMEMGRLEKESKVLDIMCGYGRHAIELAKRGCQVRAIDNAEEYIEEIKQAAIESKLPITPVKADVTALKLEEQYDMAVCMGNSLAFFNEEEVSGILKALSAHLKKGGIFIINTWMLGEIAIKYFKEKDWFYVEDYKYLIESEYLLNPTRIESTHTIITANDEIETIKGIDYVFTISEMQGLLQNNGMNLSGIYATPRKRRFRLGDTRAYIVAEKL